MTLRSRVKAALPYPLTCAIARLVNRPFLADIQRSERLVEYAWVLHHVKGPRIADVGYAGSYLAEALCLFGTVVGVDPRETPAITHPHFRREAKLSHGAPYETVVCVSVLEHLPRREAHWLLWQMVESLTPTGQALVTVPCGSEGPFHGYQPFSEAELEVWPGVQTVQVVTRQAGPNQEHLVTRVALVQLGPIPPRPPVGPSS